jgi:hypothetical protein
VSAVNLQGARSAVGSTNHVYPVVVQTGPLFDRSASGGFAEGNDVT